MTNQHPITPPPELVQQWWEEADQYQDDPKTYFDHVATEAARWGADQQLTKDAEWLDQHALDAPHLKITPVGESLKEAMRPKPPSLKEQALSELNLTADPDGAELSRTPVELIRRALEALPQ